MKVVIGDRVMIRDSIDDDIFNRFKSPLIEKKNKYSGMIFIVEKCFNSCSGIWLNLVSEQLYESRIVSRSKRILKKEKIGKVIRIRNIPIESVKILR